MSSGAETRSDASRALDIHSALTRSIESMSRSAGVTTIRLERAERSRRHGRRTGLVVRAVARMEQSRIARMVGAGGRAARADCTKNPGDRMIADSIA